MVKKIKELKKKKKNWIKIVSPREFRDKQVGETLVVEQNKVIGRTVEASLNLLTGDPRKQSVRLSLMINDIKNDQAYTEVVKYRVLDTHLRRLIKAGKDKIIDSFDTKTKDKKIKVKLFILTRNKTTKAVRTAVRKAAKSFFENYLKEKNYIHFVNDLTSGIVNKILKGNLRKVYPISVCEISKMEVLK